VSRPWLATWRQEWRGLLAAAVVLPAVYLASWTGWFASDQGYLRHRLASIGESEPPVLGALLNLLHYHRQALAFHLPLASDHPYASSAWQWLLLGRPVAFHWSGEGACGAERCASAVLLLGTPLLWGSFLPALALALWLGIARRDWRVPPILLGAAAGIVPWAIIGRVSFYFYALPAQPFLVLAVVYVLGALIAWGRTRRGRPTLLGVDWHIAAVLLAGGYVLLVALNFAYFYPIYTGQLLPYEAWQARMWLSSWVGTGQILARNPAIGSGVPLDGPSSVREGGKGTAVNARMRRREFIAVPDARVFWPRFQTALFQTIQPRFSSGAWSRPLVIDMSMEERTTCLP